MCFSTDARSTSSFIAWRTAGSLEQRMLGLDARALAVDLGPGIGAIELDMLDIAAGNDLDAALGAAACFQPHEDLVLDLQVPGVVVFAGLNHGARRRTASPPPFISIVSKYGRLGSW